ncbi:MAG: hypothetical protein CMH83_19085 [Nocardioides sp.]|nr:hypothetical protein [Nocardioides sp.]
MTFDYTQAQLVLGLPDLHLRGTHGRVDGVLPFLLRLDWRDPTSLTRLAADAGVRAQLGSVLVSVRSWLEQAWSGITQSSDVIDPESENPFPSSEAAWDRWASVDESPTDDDLADLCGRLAEYGWLSHLDTKDQQLREWLELLVRRAAEKRDARSLVPLQVGLAMQWDDRARLRLVTDGFADPYDRARLEAMSAYTEGRPGLMRCDVCERLFVPVRSGRPAQRCPGFECADQARQRYQASPERREYRRLHTRLSRARKSGTPAQIAAAQAAFDEFKEQQA